MSEAEALTWNRGYTAPTPDQTAALAARTSYGAPRLRNSPISPSRAMTEGAAQVTESFLRQAWFIELHDNTLTCGRPSTRSPEAVNHRSNPFQGRFMNVAAANALKHAVHSNHYLWSPIRRIHTHDGVHGTYRSTLAAAAARRQTASALRSGPALRCVRCCPRRYHLALHSSEVSGSRGRSKEQERARGY